MFGLLVLLIVESPAAQTTYPEKPVRIVAGFPPGSALDTVARLLAQRLAESLGKPVVVENVAGAAGNIAADRVAKAAPDGHTLVLAANTQITVNPSLYKLPYDPVKDFAPICMLAVNPYVLVVNSSVPAKNVPELIALLRANPGKYSFSSSGSGASSHLASVLFNSMANVSAVHVPYKGSSPSVTDLVSGQVAYTFETVPAVISFVKSGRLRALAISTAQRSAAMPDLPTVAAAGVSAEFGVIMLLYLRHAWDDRLQQGKSDTSDLLDAIRDGAVLRVRPKAMTVAVILAGLFPIMWGTGTGSEA